MKSEYLQILSILISVISIFLSFALGQWSKTSTYKKDKLEERYLNLYIPFFKKLLDYNYPKTSYYQISVIHDKRFVRDNILKNIEYLDDNSIKLLKLLIQKDNHIVAFSFGDPNSESQVIEAEQLFDKLVQSMQQESVRIARKLNLEPVTEGIL